MSVVATESCIGYSVPATSRTPLAIYAQYAQGSSATAFFFLCSVLLMAYRTKEIHLFSTLMLEPDIPDLLNRTSCGQPVVVNQSRFHRCNVSLAINDRLGYLG